MADRTSTAIDWIFSSRQFDPAWYRDAFPDVAALKMDPALHYRRYGSRMGRAPNAALAADPEQLQALMLPPPAPGRELLRAHEIALSGAHDRAIHYARRHLPPDLAHTLSVLQANRALAQGDMEGWLAHVNGYLCHFGVGNLQLREGASLMERLTTAPVTPVTDGPLISIIMPAFNAEKTLAAAARSILDQSWRNLELFIIDDASKDGTWDVMQEIAASDDRVSIHRNKVNVGPYVSKNIALMQAHGEWITGHDADDWAHPQRLENHMNHVLARGGTIRASLARMVRIKPDGVIGVVPLGEFAFDGVARKASISCLYEKRLLDETLGFWDSVRVGADSEMISRAQIALGEGFQILNQISMICLDMEGSLTNHEVMGVRTLGQSFHPRSYYRNAWMSFHQTPEALENLYMSFPPQDRNFPAPEELSINSLGIQSNIPTIHKKLRRIIFVVADASSIGGIPTRTRKTLENQYHRDVEYISISKTHSREIGTNNALNLATDSKLINDMMSKWSPLDTIIITSNNAIAGLDRQFRERLEGFPIIYWAAGQMAFMLQDSPILKNREYVENFLVSHIVSMSEMDIAFQRQLGIHGQSKGFAPVEVRNHNSYDYRKNTDLTYVGRIDFHAKDCERLLDIAEALRARNLPSLRVFTTDGSNSPDYNRFIKMAEERDLMKHLHISLNIEDKEKFFDCARVLILPSKKEAFGNVILEAYSFGVPVVGASYAPGPAELIEHGVTGLLMDSFSSGDTVIDEILSLSEEHLMMMSKAAFEKHKEFSMERYYDFIEKISEKTLREYAGKNTLPVFPKLKILEGKT